MGHLVFVILQMRMLRIQFAISVLLLAVLLFRGIYWKCRGRNPYIYAYIWLLPLIGCFAGKWQLFDGSFFQGWETFFWTIFNEITVLGAAYWIIAGLLCLTHVISRLRLIRRGRRYRTLAWVDIGGQRREVKVSDLMHSPYAVGVIHPYIVLPADFEERYGEQELEMVMLHEMTHIRCHHTFFFKVASFFKCIFWLNPIVHYSAKMFQTDMEIFCDAGVAEKKDRKGYGKLILKSVIGKEAPEHLLQKVTFFFSRNECRSRIVLLAGYRQVFRRYRGRILVGLGICAAVAALTVLLWSRHCVESSEGIDAVLVQDEKTGQMAGILLTDEERRAIIIEETEERLIIDTKELRETIRRQGHPVGVAGIWYNAYHFGPGVSGTWQEGSVCDLYDSSSRYVALQKELVGWKRLVRYL